MIKSFKEECLKEKPNSIVVVVGSHGGRDVFHTSDRPGKTMDTYTLDVDIDIVNQFSTKECQILEDVPKIFLIQTCQNILSRNQHDTLAPPRDKVPMKNFLVCTPQVHGFPSNRDFKKGSWFIYSLTLVFMRRAYELPFNKLLSLVSFEQTRH